MIRTRFRSIIRPASSLLLLTGLFLTTPALAGDPITGAFGLRLGAEVDEGRVESTEQDENGRTAYVVSPPNRRPPFREYRVFSNGEGVIHTIHGEKRFRLMSGCQAAGRQLVTKITRRHGDSVENMLDEGGASRWADGPRAVVLTCQRLEKGVLMRIVYTDSALAAR